MQIEGSANPMIVKRITNVIQEHYLENSGLLTAIDVVNVLDEKVYIVQIVVAYHGDDEYTIHTETVRVDDNGLSNLTFTLLSENDLDLRNEL